MIKPHKRYAVVADILYLDGTLAGITVPSGYRLTFARVADANRVAKWARKVYDTDDCTRAVGTGNRYKFASRPEIQYMAPGTLHLGIG